MQCHAAEVLEMSLEKQPGFPPATKASHSPVGSITLFHTSCTNFFLDLYSSGAVIKAPLGQGFYTGYGQTHSCLNPLQEKLNKLIRNTSLGLMDLLRRVGAASDSELQTTGKNNSSSFCSFSLIQHFIRLHY